MLPPILKTKRYVIGRYSQEDETRYLEMALDPEAIKFMGGLSGMNEEKERFQKIFKIYNSSDERWFWIWGVYKGGQLCAHVELKETEHTASNELEIVYMVHPEERRKGLMFEILKAIKENQFEWGRTIIATVSPENKQSLDLLQQWGVDRKQIFLSEDTGEQYYKMHLIQ